MMKKVEIIGTDVCLATTGKKVGEIRPSSDQCIDVFLENGVHVYAYYGTTDEKGEFYSFCRNVMACGKTCSAADSPKCRYNRKYAENAGYYVDVDAKQSVW